MLVVKSSLLRSLRVFQRFSPSGAPFVGIQWQDGHPLFHRSSELGFIESVGYDRSLPTTVISLAHLIATLSDTQVEEVDLSLDKSGILCVRGNKGMNTDELKVYTLSKGVTWFKEHNISELSVEFDVTSFRGINTSPFTLEAHPVLRNGKLMLATAYGIVMRNEIPISSAYPYPRDPFLRTISTMQITSIHITRGGYWGATSDNMRIYVAGHRSGDKFFDNYAGPADAITSVPAERLVWALRSCADRADAESVISMDPTAGLQVRDEYGNMNRFSLADSEHIPRMQIRPKTARVLYDAFSQDTADMVTIARMDTNTMRMTRGLWEVSFKTV